MSALLAPLEEVAERGSTRAPRPPLRPVAPSPLRLSRVGFIIFVITLLGAGMVGVLLLNTSIQQRAQTVVAAQRTAEDLGHEQASLSARVEQLRSSSDLADRAWAMGLRPNPHPVFVRLDADGTGGQVVGEPMRVQGMEMPDQKFRSADEVTVGMEKSRAAYLAEQEAKRKQAEADRIAREKAAQEKKAAEKKAAEQEAAQKKTAQKKTAQKKAAQKKAAEKKAAQDESAPTTNGTGGR